MTLPFGNALLFGFTVVVYTYPCLLPGNPLILEVVNDDGHAVRGEESVSSSEMMVQLHHKAMHLLMEDADKIEKLIEVQMANLTTRQCPLYEEVLDTQMYGFSREVDFAVRAGLVPEAEGKNLLNKLERNLAQLYEALSLKSLK